MFDTKPTFEHIVTDLRETQDIKIIDNGTTMKEPSCKQHQSLSWIVYTPLRTKHFPLSQAVQYGPASVRRGLGPTYIHPGSGGRRGSRS